LYNGRGRLKRIQIGTPANPTLFQDLRYYTGSEGSPTPAYDAVGNLVNIYDYKLGSPQTQTFAYDALDRLTGAQASGGTGGNYSQEGYVYDNNTGNLSSKGGVSYIYSTTHPHAVASTGNGNSYQYDANSNQTQRVVGGLTYTLSYDAENHLVTVSGAVSATFVYDGDGQRIKGTAGGATTVYIGGYFEWTGSASTMKRYYIAGGKAAMRTGSDLSWLLTDHLGSTTVTVNASLVRAGVLAYKAWGETRYIFGNTPTSSHYTDQREESSIGLYYYGARWYDPTLCRWIQPDTIAPGGVQGLDRYAYVINNPVKYIDPTGYNWRCGPDGIYCQPIVVPRPSSDCINDNNCYDAYLTYKAVVKKFIRRYASEPTISDILYMTAGREYWAYRDNQSVLAFCQEGLARSYNQANMQYPGNALYRFLSGYEPWTGYAGAVDGSPDARADLLVNDGYKGGMDPSLRFHIDQILNISNARGKGWISGVGDGNQPWQWFGPFAWDRDNKPARFGLSPRDDAALCVDLENGQYF
jgi:RHS repeat-associated protein